MESFFFSGVDVPCVNFVLEHAKAFEAVAKRGDEEFELKISINAFWLVYKLFEIYPRPR